MSNQKRNFKEVN